MVVAPSTLARAVAVEVVLVAAGAAEPGLGGQAAERVVAEGVGAAAGVAADAAERAAFSRDVADAANFRANGIVALATRPAGTRGT
jgi:hypothetical protein